MNNTKVYHIGWFIGLLIAVSLIFMAAGIFLTAERRPRPQHPQQWQIVVHTPGQPARTWIAMEKPRTWAEAIHFKDAATSNMVYVVNPGPYIVTQQQ